MNLFWLITWLSPSRQTCLTLLRQTHTETVGRIHVITWTGHVVQNCWPNSWLVSAPLGGAFKRTRLARVSFSQLSDSVAMFRSKKTPSTLSLTSCRSSSNEEFDDCCSQMGSPPAPSPSCYNYEDRVLAIFIRQQQPDGWSSSSSSSSPSPDVATPLGVSVCVPSRKFHKDPLRVQVWLPAFLSKRK